MKNKLSRERKFSFPTKKNPEKARDKAFTLIELITVLAIAIILIISGIYFYGYFQINRNLDLQQQNLIRVLRLAQTQAQSGLNGSQFGLYFETSHYILFKGSLYSAREPEYDLVHQLPNNMTISGITEIVFSRITGQPSQGGTLILREPSSNLSRVVSINSLGLIQ